MDKPMEHLKQWFNLYAGILTPNEATLYFHLFMIGNQRYWPEWIELTDLNLSLSTNINARTIPDVVNSLVQKGLIESIRGKGKAKSKYKISPLREYINTPPNYEKNDVINPRYIRNKSEINPRYIRDISEINPRLAENSPCESKDGEASKTQHKTQHTQGQGQNNISKRAPAQKKFVPPTLDDVNAYVMEKGLHVVAKDFWDYFDAGNWVDSKGNPVKNWKQKMLTWEKFHKQQQGANNSRADIADRAIAMAESLHERSGEW